MELPPVEQASVTGAQAPVVVEEPQHIEVEEGEPVKFACRITGKPRK
jgi:hypothetical protein